MQNDLIISETSIKIIGGTSESIELSTATTTLTSENVLIHGNNTSIVCSEEPLTVTGGLKIMKGNAAGNALYNQINISADDININAIDINIGPLSSGSSYTMLQGPNMISAGGGPGVGAGQQVPTELITLSDGILAEGRKISLSGPIYLSGSIMITLPPPDKAIHEPQIPIGLGSFQSSPSQNPQPGSGQTPSEIDNRTIIGHLPPIGTTPPVVVTKPPVWTLLNFTPVRLVAEGAIYLNDVLANLVKQVNLLQAHVTELETKLNQAK